MGKFGKLSLIAIVLFLAGCGGGSSTSDYLFDQKEVSEEMPMEMNRDSVTVDMDEMPVVGKSIMKTIREPIREVPEIARTMSTNLDATNAIERKVISAASISIEVEIVQEKVTEIRGISEMLGGFVEQMSTYGGSDRYHANMTVRVPQDQFLPAVDRISALGKVQSQNLGNEDVTEEFIDIEARLKSSLLEEKSILSLLDKVEKISDILTIERELSRVRSEIEKYQGRLNFLNRRVDLATINVNLFSPEPKVFQPPSVFLTIEVVDVSESVGQVKRLTSTLGGEVDNVFISVHGDKETASISLRVFTADFLKALSTIENQGQVKSKELRESTAPVVNKSQITGEPDARVDVNFAEKGWLTGVVRIIGAGLVIIVLVVLFFLMYRVGRRRAFSS